jgi:hypothetical protein
MLDVLLTRRERWGWRALRSLIRELIVIAN